ncbi:hypothetical protein ACFQ21_11125 [Ohtaekwangia kribbensis]|jgi:hypothetical protein|uniref:Helix-turn-helix type 11 domain-containing protein n=1 Tax=Ohtaekwangia kribbensis TaxID=688913 RepID=A0ABW3K1A3_9BACT
MSLLKYIQRLKRIDDLVSRKATGNAVEFAARLGISRSQLLQDIRELRELGAEIEYCSIQRSYYYKQGYGMVISFPNEGSRIKGGKKIASFLSVQHDWINNFYF